MTNLLESLEKAAKEATPGPWNNYYEGSGDFVIYQIRNQDQKVGYQSKDCDPEIPSLGSADDSEILTVSGPDSCFLGGKQSEKNAHYIALANPDNVLKLLELVKVQHEAIEMWTEMRTSEDWIKKSISSALKRAEALKLYEQITKNAD